MGNKIAIKSFNDTVYMQVDDSGDDWALTNDAYYNTWKSNINLTTSSMELFKYGSEDWVDIDGYNMRPYEGLNDGDEFIIYVGIEYVTEWYGEQDFGVDIPEESVYHDIIPIHFTYIKCPAALGNLNGDLSNGDDGVPNTGDNGEGDDVHNVLDIVILVNCVLVNNCPDLEYACAADMNADGFYNVLDIVVLANCVIAGNCGD